MAPLARTLATVRAATTLARARPAYAAGLRAAAATVGPLGVAMLVGSTGGTWLSIAGFTAALSDRGGTYRDRATTMLAVAGSTACAVMIGSVSGHSMWLAVPATFAVAMLASLARVWGASGVSIGGAALTGFVVALAFPAATAEDAVARVGFSLVGGAWAMFVALLLWPLRPYRPARVAVANAYRALGALVADIATRLEQPALTSRRELATASAALRAALESVRQVLTQLRRGRPGSSGRGEHLLVLGDLCDQLFVHAVAVAEAIETIAPTGRDAAAQLVARETLAMMATTSHALALAVEEEREALPVPLGWSGATLRSLVESRTPARTEADGAPVHYLHAAAILDRAARFAQTAIASARALSDGPGATTEFPLPDDPLADEDDASPLTTLRALITPGSVILLFALRVAAVTSLAVLLTGVLDLRRGYWVTITVIVIMQPYTGATLHRALQRVLGTVVGGILTAVLGAWFHDPRAILALAFVFATLSVALMPLNYAVFSVFLTPTFVLLAEASAGDWHLAGTRVLNTMLGGALALGGARFLWPSPEWTRLPGYMAAALRANAAYLRAVGALFADRSDAAGERLRAFRRTSGLAILNAEESVQRLTEEQAGAGDATAPALSLLTYTRRFIASTASLALARHTADERFVPAVRRFTDDASRSLERMADAMRDERDPAPSVDSALDGVAPCTSLPPLLDARLGRLARQVRMLDESIRRWNARSAGAPR